MLPVRGNLYPISILRLVLLFEHRHGQRNLNQKLNFCDGREGLLFSSTSWRWPAWVRSATVLEKKVMNSPTEERWKKPKVERSWAEASCTAGLTSLRRTATANRRMVISTSNEGGWKFQGGVMSQVNCLCKRGKNRIVSIWRSTLYRRFTMQLLTLRFHISFALSQ